MGAPRLEIDLDKIYHNARELVSRLGARGISVTGVTKATLGSIDIAEALVSAGVSGLGDSRIENLRNMRLSEGRIVSGQIRMTLIRSPMLSQIDQVVRYADISCNTEVSVIQGLSQEAKRQRCIHEIILMLELGDLREGIMPDELMDTVGEVLGLPNIFLRGIGCNLACRSGVSPDADNMASLSAHADSIEAFFRVKLDVVSGGNSANLQWALDIEKDIGRINNLRLGEAILLGCETLGRNSIRGLHTDAIRLVAEVIESKTKPSRPTGTIAQTAFGDARAAMDRGLVRQTILAIGVQDVDPAGLLAPLGTRILGASSDHLIVESGDDKLVVGDELSFQVDYSALLRAMTSPFITKHYSHGGL